MEKRLRQAGSFLCSMKCAVGVLIILAAACTVGSLIPQGQGTAYYTANYSSTLAGAVLLLGLDDIFHCWWFVGLTLLLCVNLLCCNVLRFPGLAKKQKAGFCPESCLAAWDKTPAVTLNREPDSLFLRMGFRRLQKVSTLEGRECLYASKNQAGIWGPWLCHLGMLIIIAGFGLGQIFQTVYTVYGVPGQRKAIGDMSYEMRIDEFAVELREDATVEQYRTGFTVLDGEYGDEYSAVTMVNKPATVKGMRFYQNSTGWAASLDILKGGEKIQEELLCAGEFARVSGKEELAVVLTAFYPDYYEDENGQPMTLTPKLSNPAYLYTLYYQDKILGMNVLTDDQVISVEDYTFVFHDPQQYTLIQVKRDPFGWLAAIGGLVVIVSLILAFYVRPAELWAVKDENGTWAVAGRSRKGGAMFIEEIRQEAEKENRKNGK